MALTSDTPGHAMNPYDPSLQNNAGSFVVHIKRTARGRHGYNDRWHPPFCHRLVDCGCEAQQILFATVSAMQKEYERVGRRGRVAIPWWHVDADANPAWHV